MNPTVTRTAAAIGLGVAFDLAAHEQQLGVSMPLLVAVAATAVAVTSLHSRERLLLLGAAVAIAPVAAIRSDEAVTAPILLAIMALFVLAATGPGAAALSLRGILGRGLGVMRALLRSPAFVCTPIRVAVPAPPRVRRALRTLAIAAPLVAVFALLFASADRVFAQALLPDLDVRLDALAGHVTLIAMGTWMAGAWWPAEALTAGAVAARDPAAVRPPRLSPAEWSTALGALTVLFTVFVAVQFAFLFGGRARVEVTPGLTYAEYARSGFFQLLAAGGLTAMVLLGAWDHGRRDGRRDERRFLGLAAALTALCLVVLASAALRLALYQQAFGFTISRLAAWVAIGVTGAALCGLFVAIATRRRRNVLSGALAIGLGALIVWAGISPAAFVARKNIERYHRTGTIDVDYLATLGPEATPALAAFVSAAPPTVTEPLRYALCSFAPERRGDWRSANLARSRAAAALATLRCPA